MNSEFQKNLQAYWDEFVDGYSQVMEIPALSGYTLMNMLRIENSNSILDAGCGPGLLIPEIIMRKQKECKLVSIDISKNILNSASQNVCRTFKKDSEQFLEEINWTPIQSDVENLEQFPNESFDTYYGNMVFHLTGNPELGLKEAYRVLKPGGQIGFGVFGNRGNSDQFTIFKETLQELNYNIPQGHDTFRLGEDKQRLLELLQQIGFKHILMWNQNSPYNRFSAQEYLSAQNPRTLQILEQQGDEMKEKFIQRLDEKIKDKLSNKMQPLFGECLLVIAKK